MFMVGDVKQSIYSFRLARPELFLEKYHGYQQKGEEYQLIELRNNFRSRSEVLTFVNDVFYQIMHELAAQGVAVIMNSSDMMEVIGMSSRVIVMYEDRTVTVRI